MGLSTLLSTPPFLTLNVISKRYANNTGSILALENINLSIGKGEFVSLVGGSGCGKSTLLRILAGFDTHYDGSVTLAGQPVCKPGLDRGMVFQEHRLLPWLTVEENIAFGLNGMPPAQVRQCIDQHLALVELNHVAGVYPAQLSGGMSQRVAIARALANRPEVLLLDEPFGALDALTRIQLQQEILRIWQAERTTMIMVTHDIDEAIFLGDRIIVMSGAPGHIKRILPITLPRPRDRTSQDFMELRKEIYAEFFTSTSPGLEYLI